MGIAKITQFPKISLKASQILLTQVLLSQPG